MSVSRSYSDRRIRPIKQRLRDPDENRLYLAYDKGHGGHVLIRVFPQDGLRSLSSITLAEGVSLVNDLLCAKTHRQFFEVIRKCDYTLLTTTHAVLSLEMSKEGEAVRCTKFYSDDAGGLERRYGIKYDGTPIEFGPLPQGCFSQYFRINFDPADPETLASELYLAGPKPLRANLGKRSPTAGPKSDYINYDELEDLGTKETVVIEPMADWITLRNTLAMGGSLLGNIEMAERGEKSAETILNDSGFISLDTPKPLKMFQFLRQRPGDGDEKCCCLVYPFKKQTFRPIAPFRDRYAGLNNSVNGETSSLDPQLQKRILDAYEKENRTRWREHRHYDEVYKQWITEGRREFRCEYCSDLVFTPFAEHIRFLEKSNLLDRETLQKIKPTDGPGPFDKSLVYICLLESDFSGRTQLEIAKQVVVTFLTTVENTDLKRPGSVPWGAHFNYYGLFRGDGDMPNIYFGTLAGYLWHVLCYHQGYFTATCPNCGCGFIATKQGPRKQCCSSSCRVTYTKCLKMGSSR